MTLQNLLAIQRLQLFEPSASGVRRLLEAAERNVADAAKARYIVGAAHLSFPGLGCLPAEGSCYVFVPVNYSAPAK